jgi:hypothetical protein
VQRGFNFDTCAKQSRYLPGIVVLAAGLSQCATILPEQFASVGCFGLRCSGASVVASSEYHRKQAEILAGLALTEPDQAKATQLSLLALQHRDLADKLEAGQSLQSRHSSHDDNRDRT